MAELDRNPEGGRIAEARLQLVSVAQWLARVERSFASRNPGKELSLRWRADRDAITTHDLGDAVELELRIDGLTMQFTEDGRPSDHAIDVEERSPAHVEAWILIELLHRGLDRDRFSKDLLYDTSALLNGDGVEFSPGAYEGELKELADLFRIAASAVGRAASSDATLRISPRDLCVEAVANGRTIGFSLGDARIAEPYFYVKGDASSAEPGRAATAILPASRLAPENDSEAITAFYAGGGAPTRH
ncbi:MAG: hypothetical protein DI565_12460 [Ancylobacter novellus]|uniref:Uncharacterized protein n=1 Tax=Ancylobacter novellus TaxID=921 RepID=A0A2W5M392_ANCNO|nr:MAG: hypothetical protein DI565_12460 [Ancylobacter novellus]